MKLAEARATMTDAILDFIREKAAGGASPTVREIGDHFDIRSTNGVRYHLTRLRRRGDITIQPKVARGIRVADNIQPGASA